MDFDAKSLTPEEKKMIEAKRREKSKAKQRPSRKMDIIDQLDATSIYGTGCTYSRLGKVSSYRTPEMCF
jgi:hypothetical protein